MFNNLYSKFKVVLMLKNSYIPSELLNMPLNIFYISRYSIDT